MRFRFVDRILDWAPHERIRGTKTVSFEEYNLKEPFGDRPHLPETLALESFLQLGNWLVLLSTDFRQFGLITRIGTVQFDRSIGPGQQLVMELNVVRRRSEGWEIAGTGWVDGRVAMCGVGCLAMAVPVEKFTDPVNLRVVFSEIYQPEPPDAVKR
jgi:3-hydroxymyristoyl/3-hydroxydecanoyl-(acyl carrier protein) dehydratase